jgi:hypothetical protein
MHPTKQCGEPGWFLVSFCSTPGCDEHLETHFPIRSSCGLCKGSDLNEPAVQPHPLAPSTLHLTLSRHLQLTSKHRGECHREPSSVPGMYPASRFYRWIRPIFICRMFGINRSISLAALTPSRFWTLEYTESHHYAL